MADLRVDCSEWLKSRGRSAVMSANAFRHGQPYTVTGSGFGTKATAAPLKFDNFESVTLGAQIVTSSAGGPAWTNDSGVEKPIASNALLRSGTPSTRHMRCKWSTVGGWNWSTQSTSAIYLTDSSGVWLFDGWLYVDTSGITSGGVANAKWIRLHQTGAGSPNSYVNTYGPTANSVGIGRDGVSHTDSDFFGGSTGGTTGGEVPGSNLYGHWVHWTWMIDAGSGNGASDGSILCYFDSADTAKYARITHDLANYGGVPTIGAGFSEWPEFYIGNYNRNGTAGEEWSGTVYAYWDSVYVDHSFARVEIGDNPTYASCTHREIQIPSAWSATSVTFTVNRGSFAVGSTAHIHVIDSTNAAHYVESVTVGAD